GTRGGRRRSVEEVEGRPARRSTEKVATDQRQPLDVVYVAVEQRNLDGRDAGRLTQPRDLPCVDLREGLEVAVGALEVGGHLHDVVGGVTPQLGPRFEQLDQGRPPGG